MPEPSTRILETKVVSTNGGAFRIEMALADKATAEEATESILVSVVVRRTDIPGRHQTLPALADLQSAALHRTVALIREHTRAIDAETESIRK